MIIKISTELGWVIIDNIKEISYYPYKEGRHRIVYDQAILLSHNINCEKSEKQRISEEEEIDKRKIILKEGYPPQTVIISRLVMNDDSIRTIFFDTIAYIVNDWGKTIERIN